VNTCSIGFDDPAFDESEYAARWRALQDQPPRETVDKDDYGLIDTLAHLYDEPYADSSAIPTYRVCQLARKHVTVALSGDGGDENFAGYRRYRYAMAENRCARAAAGDAQTLFGTLGKSTRRPTGRRACSAPRPPSRRWRATWSKAISTACR
jgi:asparagine synthase (glutamine-hydrolysing)